MYLFFGPEYDIIDMISYSIERKWVKMSDNKTSKRAVACITAQPHCVNIIEAAKDKVGDPGLVTAVIIRSNHIEPEKKLAEDQCLTDINDKTGVFINEIYDETPLLSLVDLIDRIKPVGVFTGAPGKGSNFVGQLALLCDTEVYMVSEDSISAVSADSELEKQQ